MKATCFAAAGLLLGGCYLDDRPSQRAAKRAVEIVRPGMTVDDVIVATQQLVDPGVWALTFEGCGLSEDRYGVQHKAGGAGFLITSFDHNGGKRSSQVVADRRALMGILDQSPIKDCRKLDIGLGQWGVPVERDAAGRVSAVLEPSFVD